MAQVRGTIPANVDNVDKTVFAIVGKTLKELTPIWRKFYNVETSDRKFERNVSYSMFGAAPVKGEGQDFTTQLIKQGWTKDFTHLEFGLAFEVTQTAQEDDVYDILSQYATGLARGCRVTEETYAAIPFNNGFSTETSPDGQAVFASAHPLVNGGTARNTRTSDLSWLALQQAIIDLNTDQKTEEGFFSSPVDGLILYVPPALKLLAERIVGSTMLPGVADNDINPINKGYDITVQVNPYLTDDDAWYLIYKGKQHGIMSYTRVPIGMQPPERLPRSGNRFYSIRFRRSWGVRQWQGVWGSPGA
jgi:Mu-like prophage major head subunit gpT